MFLNLKKECVLSETMIKINWFKNAGLSKNMLKWCLRIIKKTFADVFQVLETNENVKKV